MPVPPTNRHVHNNKLRSSINRLHPSLRYHSNQQPVKSHKRSVISPSYQLVDKVQHVAPRDLILTVKCFNQQKDVYCNISLDRAVRGHIN